jgi:hypothetical protein
VLVILDVYTPNDTKKRGPGRVEEKRKLCSSILGQLSAALGTKPRLFMYTVASTLGDSGVGVPIRPFFYVLTTPNSTKKQKIGQVQV